MLQAITDEVTRQGITDGVTRVRHDGTKTIRLRQVTYWWDGWLMLMVSAYLPESKTQLSAIYNVFNDILTIGIPIPGSRSIFPIPNPGIGDALIPGFRDYEKWTKSTNFAWHLPEKYLFSEFLGAIPGSKAESEQTRPQHSSFYGQSC